MPTSGDVARGKRCPACQRTGTMVYREVSKIQPDSPLVLWLVPHRPTPEQRQFWVCMTCRIEADESLNPEIPDA